LRNFAERYAASFGPVRNGQSVPPDVWSSQRQMERHSERTSGGNESSFRSQPKYPAYSARCESAMSQMGRPAFLACRAGAALAAWIASSEQTGLCDLAAFVEPFLRLGEDAASPVQPVVLATAVADRRVLHPTPVLPSTSACSTM
jgi:hypothetical protein